MDEFEEDEDIYGDLFEDAGSVLNAPTYFVALLARKSTLLMALSFLGCTILVVLLGSNGKLEAYVWFKGSALLVGWLLILAPARAYSPIYNFISAFKYIVIKDMVPFILFFVIISVAFGCAIQLQFQLLTQVWKPK